MNMLSKLISCLVIICIAHSYSNTFLSGWIGGCVLYAVAYPLSDISFPPNKG